MAEKKTAAKDETKVEETKTEGKKVAEPTEPAPVEVAPAETPTDVKTDNIHGKDYEISADRGYRLKG